MPSVDMNDFLNMPWTIEQQLKAYADDPRSTERHKILQNAWDQNKRLLSQIQEYIPASAAAYSRHNEVHCQSVLHNIECLMGEEEIRRLSPTDCFAILMSVYLHDIGMVITDRDRKDIVGSEDFRQMVEKLKGSGDATIRQSAQVMCEHVYRAQPGDQAQLFAEKLDIYNALAILLTEYQRRRHAEKSSEWMKKWSDENDSMYNAMFISGIPHRILLQIAEGARMHQGENDVVVLCNSIRENLLYSDNGFAEDQYHPRFICVLLLLGDLLDMDNNRFHFFTKDYCGSQMSETSEAHYRKHRAIRALKITPKRIEIRADCQRVEELRILWGEIKWLQEFVKECGYYWAEIAPESYRGYMPLVECPTIKMQGRSLSTELVTAKFQITQNKAFELLQGASIYEERYVFLRELVQNAIDATKIQYWQEYEPIMQRQGLAMNLMSANGELPLAKFPIYVDLAVKKRRRRGEREISDIVADDLKLLPKQLLDDYDIGVVVSVQDYGIGINERDIKQIADVGTSYKNRTEMISRMPLWLRPTGHFGVGLQSLFLMDDIFSGVTRTRRDECYEIVFHSGADHDGYINISPVDYQRDPLNVIPYGTKFTVFVSADKLPAYPLGAAGSTRIDPFSDNYDVSRSIRSAHAVLLQMRDFLRQTVGETIFPITIREHSLDTSIKNTEWGSQLTSLSKNFHSDMAWEPVKNPKGDYSAESRNCWMLKNKEDDAVENYFEGNLPDGSSYRFDLEKCKLFLWSQPANCFFCCGTKRMAREFYNDNQASGHKQKDSNGIQLYIKGIWVQPVDFSFNDLIEYIDVKDDSLQQYLRMNRNALETAGIRHLFKVTVPKLQKTFQQALLALSEATSVGHLKNRDKIVNELLAEYDVILQERFATSKESGQEKKECIKERERNRLLHTFKNSCKELNDSQFYCYSLCCKPHPPTKEMSCEECAAYNQGELNTASGNGAVSRCIARQIVQNAKLGEQALPRLRNRLRRVAQSLDIDIFTKILYNLEGALYNLVNPKEGEKTLTDPELKTAAVDMQLKLIFYGMCLYYANQVDPHLSRSWGRMNPATCWQYLNEQISHILDICESKNFERWRKLKPYLFVLVNGDRRELIPFGNIMMDENHFAIFSIRGGPDDLWKHYLVQLKALDRELQSEWNNFRKKQSEETSTSTIVDVLWEERQTGEERDFRWELFDRWAKRMVNRTFYNLSTYRSDIGESRGGTPNETYALAEQIQSKLLRWMVKHLPTLAIASDDSGNQRLNVLCRQVEKHVFFDSRMLRLMLERMAYLYETQGVQRFQTCVWDGLEALTLKGEVDSSIQCVTRGAMSIENKGRRMLLDIQGEIPQSDDGILKDCPTSYKLLDKLKAIFDQPDGYPEFERAAAIKASWLRIIEFLPWGLGSDPDREEDWEALKEIYSTGPADLSKSASIIDNEKETFNISSLLNELEKAKPGSAEAVANKRKIQALLFPSIVSYWIDVVLGSPDEPYQHWHEIEFPSNPREFINMTIYKALGLPKSNKKPDNLPMDKDEEHEQNIMRIMSAMNYLQRYAADEYKTEFFNLAYDFWMSAIWQKDPGRERILDTTISQSDCTTQDAAIVLYQSQIKRILKGIIIDREVDVPRLNYFMR